MHKIKNSMAGVMVLLMAFVISGCHKTQTVRGNTSRQTVERSVPAFQNIVLSGHFDVVFIGQMPQKIAVTADSNVLSYITTTVKDGTLYIKNADNVNVVTKVTPMIEINAPTVKDITINGSGYVQANKIVGDALNIDISGSGHINASGKAAKVKISVSGVGNVNAQDLIANKAKIDVSGSGNVSVYTIDELNINVSGSGLIEYYGSPSKVSQNITGSGRVIGISRNAQKNST